MWLFFLKGMKKKYRVKKNQNFTKIIQHHQSLSNKEYVLYYLKNDIHLRIGLSVSKKLGHAVIRNKIKRQVRMLANEIFDKDLSYDFIIIVRKNYLNNDYKTNRDSLISLYKKTLKRMDK